MFDWLVWQIRHSLLRFIAYSASLYLLIGMLLPVVLLAATPPSPSLYETIALIKTAKPKITDANGWAQDILDTLKLHNIPSSKENVCAVIAIIAQESNFVANPAVPNLGRLSEQAIIQKLNQIPVLGGEAEVFLNHFPNPRDSFMQRIRRAKTERDLDVAYRDLVAGLMQEYKLDFIGEDSIESNNEVRTLGAMQVSIDFANQYEAENRGHTLSLNEIYQLRDKLYSRKGGLYYGTLMLLGYETGYNKKLYRFADYNAGRYTSRNAAFQYVIASLANDSLVLDGDLLIYENGEISASVSSTEQVLRAVNYQYNLGLNDSQIRRDLVLEKTMTFNKTATYKSVTNLYRKRKKVEPAYAIIPSITLHSMKTSRVLTTEKFANTVNGRYQRCIGLP